MDFMRGPGAYDDEGEDRSPQEDSKVQASTSEHQSDEVEVTTPEDDDYDEKDNGKKA